MSSIIQWNNDNQGVIAAIMQWCNDNQGVIAAIAILIGVLAAIFKCIPKGAKRIQQINKNRKDAAHNADIKAVVKHLKDHVVATPKILADSLNKSEEDIQELLSELIDQGIVIAGCNNCKLSDPNSIWELKR